MKHVCIVGVGLMGGSLGMALRKRGWRVTGIGRDAARLRRAKARGAADAVTTDLAAGVREADVVVLAVPVDDIVPSARKAWPHLKPGALVMDVGSVKGPVVRALGGMSKGGACFVGAHPMCGSEKSGVENARPDLYRGATCVLTPVPATPRRALALAERFWRAAGARTLRLSPAQHDRSAATVSHLPHLVAEALVLAATRAGGSAAALAAGSFRDATRVAAADPAVWSSIFAANRPALLAAARDFESAFRDLLKAGPGARGLERVRRLHRSFSRGFRP